MNDAKEETLHIIEENYMGVKKTKTKSAETWRYIVIYANTPASENMFPDTKNGRRTYAMISMEFLKKISHLQSFFKVIILR